MVNKKKCAVFISGTGSNLESIIKESDKSDFPVKVESIITDNINSRGLNFGKSYNINCYPVDYKSFSKKEDFESKILEILLIDKIEIICLAGYMKILSSLFIKSFNGPIINIHPSLLPKYKGLDTHQRAIDNNDKFCGCTVHFVNSKLDSGKIILQKKVKIFKNDTVKKIKKRVLKQEHLLYPKAVLKVIFNF